ncbi:hypothetical protein ACS0TY_035883 [Phlomoides rotata]
MENVVSATADRVRGLLDGKVRHNLKLVSGAEDKVLRLANTLQGIKIGFDDFDNERYTEEMINNRLSRLEETIHEIDGVLEEWNHANRKSQISVVADKQKVRSFTPSSSSSSSCLWFKKDVRRDILHKLLIKITELDAILDMISRMSQSSSYTDSRKVHGSNTETWRLNEEGLNSLFPGLFLPYNKLPQTLKHCFSYCAVFPKDTKIVVEDLIHNWMALGYLDHEGREFYDMENKGREFYDVLVNNSLLQDLVEDDSNEIHSCKMLDTVHDFAQSLWNMRMSQSRLDKNATCIFCSRLHLSTVYEFSTLYCEGEIPPTLCECLVHLKVLSLTNCGLQSIPQGLEHLNHLRYLNLIGITKIFYEDLKIIFQLDDLQTLCLRKCGLEEIPREIGNLIHLRHLELSCNESLRELPNEVEKLIQLIHLDLSCNESLKELPRGIWNLTCLRHLNLKRNKSMKELPGEIENLIDLRRLDLSWNESLKKLPIEIGKLINLRHLNLNGNKSLEELPESIIKLRGLETLDMLGCKRICRLPAGVAELTGLRTLGELRVGSDCNKFELLKKLDNLGGALWLRIRLYGNFNSEEMVKDAQGAELSNKEHIEELRIYFEEYSSSSSSSVSLDVIDVLKPHSNLSKLSIWNYGCPNLPTWLLNSNVSNLNLHFCKHLTTLSPLGNLHCLEQLCIDMMEGLSTVGRDFLGITTRRELGGSGNVGAFRRLKTLEFRDCGKWKEWEDITEEEEDYVSASSLMPDLTELTIMGCNGLTVLPHRLLRNVSSLEKLRISGSTKLIRRYDNKDGSDWKSISINNSELKLICNS